VYSINKYQDKTVKFESMNLPSSPNDRHVPTVIYIDNMILDHAHGVLSQAQQNNITLESGLKFCRNYSKEGILKQESVKILHLPLEGSAQNRGFLKDITLRHSIFIDNVPGSDGLGVYMLCESQDSNSHLDDAPACIGKRDRSRIIKRSDKKTGDHQVITNCVVKYMLYLGLVSSILDDTRAVNFYPFFSVYKRRVYPYSVVSVFKGGASSHSIDFRTIGLDVGEKTSDLTVFWMADHKINTVTVTVNTDSPEASKIVQKVSNLIQSNDKQLIAAIRQVVPSLPLETDHSSSERGPYLGPSLTAMLKSPTVLFSEKIDMSIAFFDYIYSQYNENPDMLGFFDIKPDNFSYDRQGRKCDQNDKKARTKNNLVTKKYLMRSWQTGDSVASRDLWAMGQSLREIVESSSTDKEQYDAFALTKIWTDIQRTARLTKTDRTFRNATYIRETVLPALQRIAGEKKILPEEKLSISAENYLKDTLKDPGFTLPVNEENKAVFTCAVLGAKAYLDQHQRKDSSSKGKEAVKNFLDTIRKLSPDLRADEYRVQVTEAINEAAPKKSCLSPRLFSSSSRQALFGSYCSLVVQSDSNLVPASAESHLRTLTTERLRRLLPNVSPNELALAVDVFLGDESDSLRFQVLQQSVQYLECSKAGWIGKSAVKKLVRSVCKAEGIADELVAAEVKLSIQNSGLFKYCSSKRRQEFFAPLLPVQ